ncbi:MAG: DUF58 domain-containing protein [Planctomycetota bacterium]
MTDYLDPKTIAKADRLQLAARSIVEGFLSGSHQSPFYGYSVEFAQQREYSPGDDIRHLDWKAYAKTDRYYIKQYEEETNYRAMILLDASESMAYAGSKAVGLDMKPKTRLTKFQYGAFIAASLAYLMTRQGDAPGIALFRDGVVDQLPPSASPGQLRNIMEVLSRAEVTGRGEFSKCFSDIAGGLRTRGLVIVISDLFNDSDAVISGLKRVRQRRHETIVFQTLDNDELEFPFQDLTQFIGLEDGGQLNADPRAVRSRYLSEFNAFLSAIRKGCHNAGVSHQIADTAHPLDAMLSAYLARRSGKGGRRG